MMDSIFRGKLIKKQEFINKLVNLKEIVNKDLLQAPLQVDIVINAIDKLVKNIDSKVLIPKELENKVIEEYVYDLLESLSKEKLYKKFKKELGDNCFKWKKVDDDIEEKAYPLGVLMHIGAGNTLGLSAFSVLEGLLTGNINILKLPEYEGGISLEILMRLIEIEPRLKPYIYVADISSKDKDIIKQLVDAVNAVVVWGADAAIESIRQLTPPTVSIIEYGHRLSFAYYTKHGNIENDIKSLAKEIIMTDQLYCSSPQCVFYETDSREELERFSYLLSDYMNHYVRQYPLSKKSMDIQSQITWTQELIKMEEILDIKKLISKDKTQYSVMIDYQSELKPSPLHRHIWVMPIKRKDIFNIIRKHKGHLQTVGLSCKKEELDVLSHIFYSAGINRIMPCGMNTSHYSGEPHDGIHALNRYIRIVNRRLKAHKSSRIL